MQNEQQILVSLPFCYEGVFEKIGSIEKQNAPVFDGITAETLECSSHVIESCWTKFYNCTFNEVIFPQGRKPAPVIPLHKKGSKTKIDDYRSIPFLPCMRKVIGLPVYDRVIDYLDKQDLLTQKQFGLHAKKSTGHALIEITENMRKEDMEDISVLFETRKTFDSFDHNKLLHKVEKKMEHVNFP